MDTIANTIDRYKEQAENLARSHTTTPTLESTSTPTVVELKPEPICLDCGDQGVIGYDVPPGHPKFGKLEPCPNPVHAPERLRRTAAISGLHEADLSRRLNDIDPIEGNKEMLAAAQEMIDNPWGWLYIWGGPGNAKSETLIAIVNELNATGRGPAMYTTFGRLVEWMRDSFRERKAQEKDPNVNQGYIQRFEKVLKIKVLAIDEMDKARSTEFADDFRFHFLDERYRQAEHGLTVTIFASNDNPANMLPEPLYDRVCDGRFKVVQNLAPSARPGMKRS